MSLSQGAATARFQGAEILLTSFINGGAIMLVEILGTRIIGPSFGVGLFVWSALLSVTMASLAIGYYLGGRWVDRFPRGQLLNFVVLAAGAILGVTSLFRRPILEISEGWGPQGGSLVSATILFAPSLILLGMVGPIAVRLATNHVHATGQKVGNIYAISTAGSLLGTLLTGFVLIPNVDTFWILIGTSSTLMLLGAIPLALRKSGLALSAALIIPLCLWAHRTSTLPAGIHVVESTESFYGRLDVIDDQNRGVRLLRADHSVIGGHFVEGRSACFSFLHVLESIRFIRPLAREMLQVGLGIGSLPSALAVYGVRSDVVEIDPEVVRLAKAHFGFVPTGEVFVEDARAFLNQTKKTYDVIVHDTFTGGATPEHLLSLEVLKRIKSMLRPGGLLALNFLGFHQGEKAEASRAIMRTLRVVFPHVRAYKDSPLQDSPESIANLIFFASEGSLDFTIPSNAHFENSACESYLRAFQSWEILQDVPDGRVITDDWNPLARLQMSVTEEHFQKMNKLLPAEVWH